MEIVEKIAHLFLLSLVLYNFVVCVRVGLKADKELNSLNPILYALHLLIFGLAFVQLYQVVSLVLTPYNAYWPLAVVCKTTSLLMYLSILKFIDWCIGKLCNYTCVL